MNSIKFLVLSITSTSALLHDVDISGVKFFESNGIIYRDVHGQPTGLFQILNENSIDIIRLRLFTSNEEQAKRDPYNYGNNLNLTLKLARRIKAHGL